MEMSLSDSNETELLENILLLLPNFAAEKTVLIMHLNKKRSLLLPRLPIFHLSVPFNI